MSSVSSPKEQDRVQPAQIRVRGARVNNLKSVDVDVPYNKLTLFCGPGGSGKTSLALNVLYAEGQRRYVECFAPRARAVLESWDKPEADLIDGLPPAIAITTRRSAIGSRSTVGTATEIFNYLRLLFSRAGTQRCLNCGRVVKRYSPDKVWEELLNRYDGARAMLCFSPSASSFRGSQKDFEDGLRAQGFHRVVVNGMNYDLNTPEGIPFDVYSQALLFQGAETPLDNQRDVLTNFGIGRDTHLGKSSSSASEGSDEEEDSSAQDLMLDVDRHKRLEDAIKRRFSLNATPLPRFFVVVDRITISNPPANRTRALGSLETVFRHGDGQCWVMLEAKKQREKEVDATRKADVGDWIIEGYSAKHRCSFCRIDYPEPEPNLFSWSAPSGSCEMCGGSGIVTEFSEDLVVPDRTRTLERGAIAPWKIATGRKNKPDQSRESDVFTEDAEESSAVDTSPSIYVTNLNKYLRKWDNEGEPIVPLNVPYSEFTDEQRKILFNGLPKQDAPGLNGYFREMLKEKYKMHIRVFLSKFQKTRPCLLCGGKRFRQEALGVALAVKTADGTTENKTILDFTSARVSEALAMLEGLELTQDQEKRVGYALRQLKQRLASMEKVGLESLTLDRPVRSLSLGERRRVDLTKALGSDLVGMLYVLDEPSAGLHPSEMDKLSNALLELRDRGNTVVVVDNAPKLLERSDKIVEFGRSERSGESDSDAGVVVFDGTPQKFKKSETLTASYISGSRPTVKSRGRDVVNCPFLTLTGASGRNLQNVDVSFPLGTLCLVTGVSGAGKTTLVADTLFPALCQKINVAKKAENEPAPFAKLRGYENLEEVVLIDQTPIGRSPRSNPVTYMRVFDEIRALYAETPEAKARGYNAGYFSFNVKNDKGGRCDTCRGEGYVQVDMKFMPDVYMRCPDCNGKRYQKSTLDVLYRGKSIADVLDLTAIEAFNLFRTHPGIQQKLQRLINVGLGRIKLGQPGNTLSGGEAQRLKLASLLDSSRKESTLFILDEPTEGMHFHDVMQLLSVFNDLVDVGASIIVVDHHPLLMRAADYIIDLGPGAGDKGGRIVAKGTPTEVALVKESLTGQILAASPYQL